MQKGAVPGACVENLWGGQSVDGGRSEYWWRYGEHEHDDDVMRMQMSSDRAIKENIVRIGTRPAGFGLYLFGYKPAYRETAGF